MRRTTRAFAAAFSFLLAATSVQALEPNHPPFEPTTQKIDVGVLDPANNCLLHPELCEPEDPCLEHPELCNPEPPDPCEANPNSLFCNPIDLCEIAPALCSEDPPVLEPVSPSHIMLGAAIVRVGEIRITEEYSALLSFSTTELTFTLVDADGAVYTGNLAPKGKSGRKFSVFLDSGSSAAFAAFVAKRGAVAASIFNAEFGNVIGDFAKIVLKLDEEGTPSLKIKSETLTTGIGAVSFKVNMAKSEER